MIKFEDFIKSAITTNHHYLHQQTLDSAIQVMNNDKYVYRKHLGMFGERFEYPEHYLRILSLCAAYIDLPVERIVELTHHTDSSSPLEFVFLLAFILYGHEHLDELCVDGVYIPIFRGETDKRHRLAAAIHSQFPLRLLEFRRDIDFVIQIGQDEVAIEIDGSFAHSDERSLRRDLSAEAILHTLETPLLRISSSDVKYRVFRIIHQLVCKSQEKYYHQLSACIPPLYTYTHTIQTYVKPVCLLTFLAKILDYYFNVRVAFSIQSGDIQHTEHLISSSPEQSEFGDEDIQVLKPGEYTTFMLKYLSMHADFCVDFESIRITSKLRLTQHALIQAIAAVINYYPVMSKDNETYQFRVFNDDFQSHNVSTLVRISVMELRRRIEFLQNRSFAIGAEPYNQKALGCPEPSHEAQSKNET